MYPSSMGCPDLERTVKALLTETKLPDCLMIKPTKGPREDVGRSSPREYSQLANGFRLNLLGTQVNTV